MKKKQSNRIIFFLLLLSIITLQAKVKYIFSHGLADTFKQANKYAKTYKKGNQTYHNKRYILEDPITFNYPDAFLHRLPKIKYASLAQDNEIVHLKREIEKIVKKETDANKIILFGISRGASTALNFMALHNHPSIGALVLESPFDSVASIIDNKRKKLPFKWLSHDMGELIMETIFRRYKRNGIRPIDLVSGIRKDLPIIIVCSKKDTLVPWHSSVKLYKKLKESGHQAVHLFVANHGKHSKILMDKDGHSYQAAVHAFYAKYDLPHDNKLALQGKKYL
ncbi:MAG: prolyl oligopeptidase family serine peptidase [Candidatus Babeliales bacterium]